MSSNKISISNVRKDKSEDLIQEIMAFWQKNKAIPPSEDIAKRAQQVVIVARNEKDEIIGVTTAFLKHYPPLKSSFFVFRGMIAKDYRIPGLFIKISKETIQELESYTKKLTDSNKPIGIIAEMENPQLKSVRSTKTPTGMTLIGFSNKDNPIYVYYFQGARFGGS